MHLAFLALALTLSTSASTSPPIQEPESGAAGPSLWDIVEWVEGPGEAQLGNRAQLDLPEGFRFTGPEGTRTLMEAMQNPVSGRELGLVFAETPDGEPSWFVVFEFDESGYVKDDDRDELDAGDLMDTLQEGNEYGNAERKKRGWGTIELVGWQREPFYDPKTNNLTWATLGRGEGGGESVNWSVRVLGRKGVMNVDLVLGPEDLAEALPRFEQLMSSMQYQEGERYAQFTAGDKIAEYGLAALVAGGGVAIAAKTGLLAKFWKVIAAGLVAVGAFAKKIFGWISGRGDARPADGGN